MPLTYQHRQTVDYKASPSLACLLPRMQWLSVVNHGMPCHASPLRKRLQQYQGIVGQERERERGSLETLDRLDRPIRLLVGVS